MIQKVIIKNFKKFQHFTCDLTDGVSLIAGPNNSGKTTLLQAIALWSEIWQNLHLKDLLDGSPEVIDFTSLEIIQFSSFRELWYNCDTSQSIIIQITLKNGNIGFKISYIDPKTVEITPIKDPDTGLKLLKECPLKTLYIPSLSYLDIEEPIYDPSVLPIMLAQGKGGLIIRNLLFRVHKKTEMWESLQNTVKEFFGYELLPPSGSVKIHADFRHSSKANSLDLINGASGLLQVVLLQSALLQSSKDTVLLIDEPDAHLHNLLKAKIYRLIRNHCSINSSQAVMASHSGRLINEADKEQNLFLISSNRLTKIEKQRAKDISNLPTQHIVHAEIKRRVLYLEGKSDLDILLCWANTLNHPTKNLLDGVFWVPTAEMPIHTNRHFKGLKAGVEDLVGLEIRDKDEKSDQDVDNSKTNVPEDLNVEFWNRREIENYLINPLTLKRYISQRFGEEKSKLVYHQLKQNLTPALIKEPLADGIGFHQETKGKRFISEIFKLSGIKLHESQFYTIAGEMDVQEIHLDVIKMLDLIEEKLGDGP